MQSMGYAHAIQSFSHNLSTLRDFVNFVSLAIEKNLKATIKEKHDDLLPFVLAIAKLDAVGFDLDEENIKEIECRIGGDINVQLDECAQQAHIKFSDRGKERSFAESLLLCARSFGHKPLLYNNALVSLVSAAEVFISQLLHIRFRLYPQAAQIEKENITFAELRMLGSISDAEKHLVDKKVESIVRDGVDGCISYFKQSHKLELGYVDKYRENIKEVILRRNLVVHNDGRVSQFYINNVRPDLRICSDTGRRIEVDKEYLNKAIDVFEASFLVLASEVWSKRKEDSQNRGKVLNDLAYRHLCDSRWCVAEAISALVKDDKLVPEREALIARVNYWQSLKWQDRYEEIENEVKKEDFSAKEDRFKLAQYVILDDADHFFNALPSAVAAGQISLEDLAAWPLFRRIRLDPRYGNFCAAKGVQTDGGADTRAPSGLTGTEES